MYRRAEATGWQVSRRGPRAGRARDAAGPLARLSNPIYLCIVGAGCGSALLSQHRVRLPMPPLPWHVDEHADVGRESPERRPAS